MMKSDRLARLTGAMRAFEDLKEEAGNPDGWIKAVRTEQAMSGDELGRRLRITRQSALAVERRERDGSITLETLRKAARALNMELVYGFAPVQNKQTHPLWKADTGDWMTWGLPEEMSNIMNYLQSLIGYHRWAHEKIMPVLKDLTAEEWNSNTGGSFPTLKALYQHMLLADYRWLQRWLGVPKATPPPDYVVEGYHSLERLFRPQLGEMEKTAKECMSEGEDEPVHFITGSGLDVTQPFWQTLYQVVNHGSYHRGQVTSALRVLGKQPVATDIFLFFREEAANAGFENI